MQQTCKQKLFTKTTEVCGAIAEVNQIVAQ